MHSYAPRLNMAIVFEFSPSGGSSSPMSAAGPRSMQTSRECKRHFRNSILIEPRCVPHSPCAVIMCPRSRCILLWGSRRDSLAHKHTAKWSIFGGLHVAQGLSIKCVLKQPFVWFYLCRFEYFQFSVF